MARELAIMEFLEPQPEEAGDVLNSLLSMGGLAGVAPQRMSSLLPMSQVGAVVTDQVTLEKISLLILHFPKPPTELPAGAVPSARPLKALSSSLYSAFAQGARWVGSSTKI